MAAELVRYNAAKSALAEARSVDEVKGVLDKAEAMRHYATMAKDKQLLQDAAEIKDRAERRFNQLLEEKRQSGEMAKHGRPPKKGLGVPLKKTGVDKNLAKRLRKRKAMDLPTTEEEYERDVVPRVRSKVTQAQPPQKSRVPDAPINVGQFAHILGNQLLEEVEKLVRSRNMTKLIELRGEVDTNTMSGLIDKIDRARGILDSLKYALTKSNIVVIGGKR